ncbi:MAG: radical SAM protein [Desulfobaccales bacterium]
MHRWNACATKRMRLLFISTNRCRLVFLPLPLGLAAVVAAVGSEHEVRVLDFMFAEDPLAQVDRAVAELRPELIGISVRNIDNQDSRLLEIYFPEVKDLVQHLQGISPAPVVLGGAGFSVAPLEFMEFTGADFGMVGEGEFLVRFLQAYPEKEWDQVPGLIWRQDGGLKLNRRRPIRQLDLLPGPALEYFTPRHYQETQGSAGLPGLIPVQSRRGCPMRCIYCSTPLLEGAQTRAWAPEQVASWLAAWQEQWGLTRFYFVDNIFNCPVDYGRRLCRAIAALRLPLEWVCLINPAFPDQPLFELIRTAGGVMVQVGNDSGSELVLSRLGKGFELQQVERTLKLLQAANLPFTCFLLLGGPGETRETVQESVAFLEAYQPKMVNLKAGIRIHPGLPLHRLALAEGVVKPEDNLLWPKFYLAPAIREWIWDYLGEVSARHPNWIL